VVFLRIWVRDPRTEEASMTDERTPPPQGTDELDEGAEPRRPTDRDDDRRSSESVEQSDSSPLLREGPDAPDAADIEDPDEQL
jgi:hypothetical protein